MFVEVIINNLNWIFSGIGVFILALLIKKTPPVNTSPVNINVTTSDNKEPRNKFRIVLVVFFLMIFITLIVNLFQNRKCELAEIDLSGTWELYQSYKVCQENNSNLEWKELIVYYKVNSIRKIGDSYIMKTKKYGENYLGREKIYSRTFPVETLKGYIENCSIVIPIKDTIESTNQSLINIGEFRFSEYEEKNGKRILKGDFYHSLNSCKGTIHASANKN